MVKMARSGRNGGISNSNKSSVSIISLPLILSLLMGFVCFYGGFLVGSASSTHTATRSLSSEVTIQRRIQEAVNQAKAEWSKQQQPAAVEVAVAMDDTAPRFPNQVADFAVGMSVVDRDDFAHTFETGVPLDPTTERNEQVMIIYANNKALPTSDPFKAREATSQTALPEMEPLAATENCDFLNIVLTDHNPKRRQCIALMGQYEAFHIQKFMRLPTESGQKLDSSLPLRIVNRGAQSSGRLSTKPPSVTATKNYWEILVPYLQTLETVLEKLRPVAAQVAKKNTVIVLVSNFGQAHLLVNFVCAASQRGIDLSAVLVFATDEETRDLAESLGLTAFYDDINFADMPKDAAKRYADKTFTKMMLAKVYCVQMISMLGYDVLFQDVDIVWYRDPLEYFHDENSPHANFDVYFQDDGNHALFYAPYSANTGFYYIRNNVKTQHFFNTLLMSGDLIIETHSHQVPLVALLTEHASMYGIKVKIFARSENEFPGGHAFHRRKDFMKEMIQGNENPYIFHMSWTKSEENKRKFFEQLGEWRVQDVCLKKPVREIDPGWSHGQSLVSTCCAVEPLVTCHYRDKPSKNPCKDSPSIDKGRPSFW